MARGEVAIPARLRASWRRSERYGVPVDEVRPAFTGSVDGGSLFFECGHEVLSGLHETLANEPISLMLTDSEGLVLSRLCSDSAILRSLDKVHLAPGFCYSERNAGTNGLGLALADRAPSLVSAEQHYCSGLWGYTCAAAPVVDPGTGALVGTVNLTTWSESSKELLLAVAQAAAGNTSALMMARGTGRTPRPAPRGEVFRVYSDRLPEQGLCLSTGWEDALDEVARAMSDGRVVAVVGEAGAGKTALASIARQSVRLRERVLNARPPAPQDVDAWLALWTPELGKEDTCVIISGVDALPASAAGELAPVLSAALPASPVPFAVTAEDPDSIPEPLVEIVDTVVEVPALRFRPDDVLPLARYFAGRRAFAPAALRALMAYQWPGNVRQLREVVRQAAARADVIDTRHLAPEVFSGATRRLTRIETVERDEIVRCLALSSSVTKAGSMLGMSRATIYRKIAHYDIKVPGRG